MKSNRKQIFLEGLGWFLAISVSVLVWATVLLNGFKSINEAKLLSPVMNCVVIIVGALAFHSIFRFLTKRKV